MIFKIWKLRKFGGLSMKKFGVVNTNFLAKLGWKYLTQPDNFWVKPMRVKYGPPDQFFHVAQKPSHSWVWKCLLHHRAFIAKRMRWQLGNGQTINFWTHVWGQDSGLVDLINVDSAQALDVMLPVSGFILPDKRWDILKLLQIVPAFVLPHVLVVPISLTNVPDTFCWGFTGSGDSLLSPPLGRHMIISVRTRLHGSLSGDRSWMSC